MTTPAIRAEHLGKRYTLARNRDALARYKTLRESVTGGVATLARRIRGQRAETTQDFWALRDVSFDVRPGEVVGIIGRNGAGKSTLLKILSRITRPSTGRVILNGRVGSLLEVGTGFHPELTGRENVYLNGSILGMARREIDRKFDEIVAFSEVEKFLDTPVKRYSSGMYVRLAFAVAAHLDPEILLVDEVLAVGDARFQQKCMGRIGEIGRSGRTVLFVSHNMNAVAKLTTSALYLDGGRVAAQGPTNAVVQQYLAADGRLDPVWERPDPENGSDLTITSVRACTPDGRTATRFAADQGFTIEIGFTVRAEAAGQVMFRLNTNEDGSTIFSTALSDQDGERGTVFAPGVYTARCRVPANLLVPGSYHLLVAANNLRGRQFDLLERVLNFEVSEVGTLVFDQRLGYIAPLLPWELERSPAAAERGA